MPHANINGASLYYEDSQTPGEVILFHHGYTGSHDSWEIVAPAMARDYRTIMMDCRGAGDSEHTADGYSIAQFADDVIGMANHLGVDKFTYVGHSMGGGIGMELGLRYADRLNKLVLVAPVPADGIDTSTELQQKGRAHGRALRDAKDRYSMIEERMALSGYPDYDRISKAVDRALSVSEGHYEQAWASFCALRIGDRLGEIKTPTLIFAGAADGLLTANLKDFPRFGDATLHVFSGVAHGVHQETPEPFIDALRDFMKRGVVTSASLQRAAKEPALAR